MMSLFKGGFSIRLLEQNLRNSNHFFLSAIILIQRNLRNSTKYKSFNEIHFILFTLFNIREAFIKKKICNNVYFGILKFFTSV